MPRQPIARRVFDRVALLVCAAGIFGGGLGLVLTAERYLALGEGWTRFCLAGVGFIALGTYFGATLPGPRAYRRRPDFWPLLLTTAASPVALLFVLIRVGILSMPDRMFQYMVPSVVTVPVFVMVFHWLVRRLYGRKTRRSSLA